ncbi:MAG: 30S ribosomal protein S16, partial [Acidobacteria bacterium]|nr:30S ribosomal protein S16 [Acidobacteriota bacterium]
MLTIRMRRVGAKKKPLFRLVVTESRTARDGAALEVVGHYNPTAQPETVEVDRQRLRYWVDRGAQLSDTVRTLVARHPEAAAGAAAEETPAAEPTPAPEPVEETATAAEAEPAAVDAEPAAEAEPATEAEPAAESEPAAEAEPA